MEAANSLQASMSRCLEQERQMQATRHRIGGARRLQAGVCAHIQRHKYFCTVWATLRIKAHLRRARCRAAAPAIAMSVLRPASLLLQAYVHRALTRRRHHAKRHACSCLQAVQQGRLQQRRGAVYLERAVAARCLQACFRRLLCRRAPRRIEGTEGCGDYGICRSRR